ncbi:uncharacterized protein METZ01_LOCUS190479, partial [marine metagenome]
VVLKPNVTAISHSVRWPFDELTARYQFGPLLTPQLVLDDLGSVEPVLDVTALHDDAARIPFAGSVH